MTARRLIVLFAGVALLSGAHPAEAGGAQSPATFARARTAWPRDAARVEATFVRDINHQRAGQGLPALQVRANLTRKARSWATTMAAARRIWHSRISTGVTGRWRMLGENVGRGRSEPDLHAAFVASDSHLKNLVEPGFRYVGVGVVIADGVIYVSEVFMQPPAKAYARPVRATRRRPAPPAIRASALQARLARAPLAPTPRPGRLFRLVT